MSTSWSPEQWDEEFESLIDLSLGLMALNEGQRYLNRIQRMPVHTSIRSGHQYMLELINEHPDRLEQVMIFIYVISQKATNRMAMEDW